MPKVAILSDIHGNLQAFEAVLREVAKCSADEIIFGGDIVGYGARPAECVRMVRALGGNCVFGNHESLTKRVSVIGIEGFREGWENNPVVAGAVHAYRSLDEDAMRWISELPWFLPLNDETILAHAGLENPNQWPYLDSPETAQPSIKILEKRGLKTGFFGHTHRFAIFPAKVPSKKKGIFELPEDQVFAITVGSVGQPREPDERRAAWVLWDPDDRTVEFKQTEYDPRLAAKEIIDAGLPESSARRLLSLSASRDEEL